MSEPPLPVYHLGDSHVRYFKKAAKLGILAPHEVSGVEVGGATAVGMRNPNAKTNSIGRFRDWIRDKPRESVVVFHLGEVDCGFVIWHRAAKYDEPIEFQIKQSIDAYFEFIDELLNLGFTNIVITAATLPTITDGDQIGEVVIKRSSITATQKERTDLTIRYNSFLHSKAALRGLPYADITPYILDPKTGVVDNRMRNPKPNDHHMNGKLAAVYWAERLRPAISHYQTTTLEHRHWKCTRGSFLKAYPGHSKSMESDMTQQVRQGDTVIGDAVQTRGQYTVLRNATVNGRSYPLLNLLHTDHYAPAY